MLLNCKASVLIVSILVSVNGMTILDVVERKTKLFARFKIHQNQDAQKIISWFIRKR